MGRLRRAVTPRQTCGIVVVVMGVLPSSKRVTFRLEILMPNHPLFRL